MDRQRVLSGMRPTGKLHLGHLHGTLGNWVKLQDEYECFFFVADWHALTSEYENTTVIKGSIQDVILDWLSVGIDPEKSTIFTQSKIMEHAELHLLLSMIVPLPWLSSNLALLAFRLFALDHQAPFSTVPAHGRRTQ